MGDREGMGDDLPRFATLRVCHGLGPTGWTARHLLRLPVPTERSADNLRTVNHRCKCWELPSLRHHRAFDGGGEGRLGR